MMKKVLLLMALAISLVSTVSADWPLPPCTPEGCPDAR